MAVTGKFPLLENSQTTLDEFGVRAATLRGVIEDTVAFANPNDAITRAISAGILPSIGTAFTGDTSGCVVRYYDSIAFSDKKAQVSAKYERLTPPSISGGAAMGRWYITADSSTTVGVTTTKHPGGPSLKFGYSNNKQKLGEVQYRRPARAIELAGIFRTRTDAAAASAKGVIGMVNSVTLESLPKGYWLVDDVAIRRDPNGNVWYGSARWITLINEDWSSWLFYRDDTGQAITPNLSNVSGAYKYGFYPALDADQAADGVLRVGLYDIADIAAAFPT